MSTKTWHRVLGIESSSHVASVAVWENGLMIGEYTINHPKTHSQKLMPMLEALLKELELKIADFDAIAVTAGPGSFTGVRIGVSTVKALAQPYQLPIVGVSSLEALAYGFTGFDGLICVMMDARKNEVYAGVYKWEERCLAVVIAEQAISPDELLETLSHRFEKVLLAGDGLPKYQETYQTVLKERLMVAPASASRQRAALVIEAALNHKEDVTDYGHVAIEYLRKSEAETTYEAKHGKGTSL